MINNILTFVSFGAFLLELLFSSSFLPRLLGYLCLREIDDELIDFCIKTGRLYENSTYHNKDKHMLTLRHIGYGIPNVDKTIHNNEYRITIVTYII